MSRKIRPVRIEGNIAYVPLTQGLETIIDAADVALVGGCNWAAARRGNTFYAVAWRARLLHRAIMGGEGTIDHIDGDGLNNRRANLRFATHGENMRNAKKSARNTSGAKGVSFNKIAGKWVAYICIDRHQIHLGTFWTCEEAKAVRDAAAAIYHGPFARHA